MVKAEVHVGLHVTGLKLHDAPVGNPLHLRSTLLVLPEVNVIVTVVVALPPAVTDPLAGFVAMEKPNAGAA
jgi:hypothetical protein